MIDFKEINDAALQQINYLVPQWLPHGKQQGPEWIATNPTRTDAKPGSFKVNMNTGFWSDFATNESGKTIGSLYHYLFPRGEYRETMKELQIVVGVMDEPLPKKAPRIAMIYPTPPQKHGKNGIPTMTWTYHDSNNKPVAVVYRFDRNDKKSFAQLKAVQGGWSWGGITTKRPLYNLPEVISTTKPVIIHEGEKATDAGQKLLPKSIHTTTMQGAQSPDKTDFTPLKNCDVGIWPDNDEAGKKYCDSLIALLQAAGVKSISVLDIPSHWDNKWDAADILEQNIDISKLKWNRIDNSVPKKQEGLNSTPNEQDCGPFLIKSNCVYYKAKNKTGGVDLIPVYKGKLDIVGVSVNIDTDEHLLQVSFKTPLKIKTLEVAQKDVATKKGVIENISARGGLASESNAGMVSTFLIERYGQIGDKLTHDLFSKNLGIMDGGLVMPYGSYGFTENPIKYIGNISPTRGNDKDAYSNFIKNNLIWWGGGHGPYGWHWDCRS